MNKSENQSKKASAPETRCPYTPGQGIEVEWYTKSGEETEWRPATFALEYTADDRPWRASIVTSDGACIAGIAPECIRAAQEAAQ